jgi:hypothetical protein
MLNTINKPNHKNNAKTKIRKYMYINYANYSLIGVYLTQYVEIIKNRNFWKLYLLFVVVYFHWSVVLRKSRLLSLRDLIY